MPSSIPPRKSTRRVVIGATLGLVAVIALFAASGAAYLSASTWVDHTMQVQQATDQWLVALLDAEGDAKGYILAPDQPSLLKAYEKALGAERECAARVQRLVVDNSLQSDNVEVAERHAQIVVAHLDRVVELVRVGRRSEAIAQLSTLEIRQEVDTFHEDIDRIGKREAVQLVDRRAMVRTRAAQTAAGAALLSIASLGMLVFAWRTRKEREAMLDRLAQEARLRLQAFSEMAVALSEARSRTEVAEVIVAHGVRACDSNTSTLHVFDDSGRVLELIGHKGIAPDVADRIRRIARSPNNPRVFEALASERTLWAENESDLEELFPAFATPREKGPRIKAFWSVPLVGEGGLVGLLGLGFYESRRFLPDEQVFVETLGRQCAQALLRAARLEGEDEARQWFTTTLKSIGDAVIATDAEGEITFMNPIAEGITGWSESEARGRPLEEVFRISSEETGAPVESPVAKVLREGMVVGLANHTVLHSKGGVDIPIDDSGAPIRSEDGRLFGVVLVFRDVRQEKAHRIRSEFLARAGEALASSVDYQATVAAVARVVVPAMADWCTVNLLDPGAKAVRQVAVAHVDPDKVRFARELGERYPMDRRSPIGTPEVVRTGKSELYPEVPDHFLPGLAVDAQHLRLLRELKLRSAMVVPLKAHGSTIGAMTFVYGDSPRRYTESDLALAEDFARRAALAIENARVIKEAEIGRAREGVLRTHAETASRAKDEFLAMVSHELRTPLTAILGWAVTLRGRGQSTDVDRALAVIERNARTQAKLIDDVLDVSRIVSGNLALALGPTNLAQVVAASVETVTPAAEAKEIGISVNIEDRSLSIVADADRVQQVVWNLLSNAVKFTPKGGQVFVDVRREGSDVLIRVRDTGEGVRADLMPFIFEPFRQADASPTRRHGGLGLGLAIVKQLVSAHGGTVTVESGGENRGSTFTVRLPARAVVTAVKARARSEVGMRADAKTAAPPRLDGLRVVVVDDEEDALQLVSEVLRERGADVYCVASALEAVDRITKVKPDVIVSDIGMPLMDGFALIRRIRALPAHLGGRTPAVALTAYARTEDAQKAFAAGYQMHVAKPIEPFELVTVVANLGGRTQEEGVPSVH